MAISSRYPGSEVRIWSGSRGDSVGVAATADICGFGINNLSYAEFRLLLYVLRRRTMNESPAPSGVLVCKRTMSKNRCAPKAPKGLTTDAGSCTTAQYFTQGYAFLWTPKGGLASLGNLAGSAGVCCSRRNRTLKFRSLLRGVPPDHGADARQQHNDTDAGPQHAFASWFSSGFRAT
jgi:hypothetical protein